MTALTHKENDLHNRLIVAEFNLGQVEEELRRLHEENEALRARLAQPEPEPVAWVAYETDEKHGVDFDEDEIAELPVGTMLYTTPPQREWQGLTDEEYEAMAENHVTNCYFDTLTYARAIEAKLKEKNT